MENNLFAKLNFKGSWRTYQKRVLDNLSKHLSDNKIHIVAAPGSGKTVLGIELLKRLGKNCLILSPSLAIRDQWETRLINDFGAASSIISKSLDMPLPITIVTYQSLYNFDTIRSCFGTIILDEAHHLRREWWNALSDMVNASPDATIVSLTATPPYDAAFSEWNKYISLCGPIDEEITVPELVKEGSLCPHQDFIYFSHPKREEKKAITKITSNANKIYNTLLNDEEFHRAIMSHSVVLDTNTYADLFLDDMDFVMAFFVYARHLDDPVYIRLKWLIGENTPIPKMSIFYMEKLLQGYLYDFKKDFHYDTTYNDYLRELLESNGLVHRKKVQLTKNDRISHIAAKSISKMDSICSILKSEHRILGNDLRMLIVTDYIKKEYMKVFSDPSMPITDIGVIPIFETIRRFLAANSDSFSEKDNNLWLSEANLCMGVLTGSLCIIPFEALNEIKKLAAVYAIDLEIQSTSATGYYIVTCSAGNILTKLMTELFEKGFIRVLIGTSSLLGEGWDAPCINSLIFASTISSYVSSNQIRGRAIRINTNNLNKTANIFHLACLTGETTSPSSDIEQLALRFQGFMGLCYDKPLIENGIERITKAIGYGEPTFSIEKANTFSLNLSTNRDALITNWKNACLDIDATSTPVKNEVILSNNCTPARILFKRASTSLISFGTLLGASIGGAVYVKALGPNNIYPFIFLCGSAILFCDYFIKNLNKAIYYKRTDKMLAGFGNALLDALIKTKKINPDSSVSVVAAPLSNDPYSNGLESSIYLKNGTIRENEIFRKCVLEFFSPVDNQRYILKSEQRLKDEFAYSPVPSIFSKNKADAEAFHFAVNSTFAKYKLIYTRNETGRKELMNAIHTSYFKRKAFNITKRDKI